MSIERQRRNVEKSLRSSEAKIKLAFENAERSNKDLEQFAYIASHDLQEPLRMVASYVQLLEKRYKKELDDTGKEFIQFIVQGTARMQKLIDDLLAYSRVSTNPKAFSRVDCSEVVKNVIFMLQLKIKESKAIIRCDPLPTILGDDTQLTQVFLNLISNAIKFNDKNPRIHISCSESDKEWRFCIQDNGIGIDTKNKNKLFVIFNRLTTDDQYPGSGIGLAVCKKIITRHQGQIGVDSKLGAGANFFFTIPKNPEY